MQGREFLRLKKSFGSSKIRMKILVVLATVFLFGILSVLLGVGLLFAWYAKDLPRPDKVRRVTGLSTTITDRNNKYLYDVFQNENRIPAKWEDIPNYLKQATIAVEDKEFYSHNGLSTRGIARAMFSIFFKGSIQGGSTLSQQLVKNVLLTTEQTIPRKMKEAILAIQVEQRYTKDQILLMYLNEAPYGGTAVGVEAASQQYFGKPVKDLGLLECVFLAGLPQNPSYYSPLVGSDGAYITRSQAVARRMREDGYITPKQEAEILAQLPNMQFGRGEVGIKAPHFVMYVRDLLTKQFGADIMEKGGLHVTTSLDLDLQEKAQTIVKEEVNKAKPLKVSNGAAIVLNPDTGEILAMVGSKDYDATDSGGYKFNVVTQSLRQPGSTIKPIVYASAFLRGYTPATMLMDVDTKYPSGDTTKPEYNPKNYDLKYRGPMLLRNALGNSINTIAVKITALVGIHNILSTAFDMGLSTLEPTDANLKRLGLSISLGGGEVYMNELASAFGVFATGGLKVPQVAILKVTDSNGTVLYEYKPTTGVSVLPPDVSSLINDILSDNDARKDVFGTNSLLVIPKKTVAVKTGTTDDKRDNWTVGYTRRRVVAAWVGNNDNSPMNPALASGVTGAAPIWNRIIKEAIKDLPDESFTRPDTIVELEIDPLLGGLVVNDAKKKERFIKGTEPTAIATNYQDVKVSRLDKNKLANQLEIIGGDYDTKKYIVLTEQDPVSSDGKNRWQEGIDAWVASQPDDKYRVPKETYDGGEDIRVRIKRPNGNERINSTLIHITAEAASRGNITKMYVYANDKQIIEKSTSKIDEGIALDTGSYKLRVRAEDDRGKSSEAQITFGVNQDYKEAVPTPTP